MIIANEYEFTVSIHAPAWGATFLTPIRHHHRWRFNPRARVGRDYSGQVKRTSHTMFQSTRPRGARRVFRLLLIHKVLFQSTRPRGARRPARPAFRIANSFNPRARVGRDDVIATTVRLYGGVSIHAPAWGATADAGQGIGRAVVSIHAPAWGATPYFAIKRRACMVSIHAPAWGATVVVLVFSRVVPVSIHAPAWGATSRLRIIKSN